MIVRQVDLCSFVPISGFGLAHWQLPPVELKVKGAERDIASPALSGGMLIFTLERVEYTSWTISGYLSYELADGSMFFNTQAQSRRPCGTPLSSAGHVTLATTTFLSDKKTLPLQQVLVDL